MKIIYATLVLLLFCELGQWVVNHYVIKALENHNKSFKSVFDILKMR